jgi:hypothetical protein
MLLNIPMMEANWNNIYKIEIIVSANYFVWGKNDVKKYKNIVNITKRMA